MLKSIRNLSLGLLLSVAALPLAAANLSATATPEARTAEQVRRQIAKLPFLSVFDNISFTLQDGVVTLDGDVYRRSLRKSAERVALQVEGVTRVENNIEFLPVSNFDDQIRVQLARALFTHPALDRYSLQANPPIRIIVRNGNVTLAGVVNREMEKNVAGVLANQIHGVFSVTNDLRVEIPSKS
ncbi:MAG: BON domain-containing protein [Acidobacteria bacterium]|nr:BON domain-containing protein [Acidobacteriota bacterium]